MAIRIINGKKETTYRVEVMISRKRISKTFKTRSDAEDFENKTRKSGGGTIKTISQLADDYFCSCKIKDWKNRVTHAGFWVREFRGTCATKITHLDVEKKLNKLRESGLSENTVLRYRTTLSQMYEYSKLNKYNPARSVKYQMSVDNPQWYK